MTEEKPIDWQLPTIPSDAVLYFPNKTDEELSKLAKDIAMNLVFTSDHMKEYEGNLIGSVFMPVGLGALSKMPKEMIEDIGFVYAYYADAGPRSINRLPMFMSCAFVSRHDAKIIWEKVEKISDFLKQV